MMRPVAVTSTAAAALPELVPDPVELPAGLADLRAEVRSFLDEERGAGRWTPRADVWLSG